MSIYSDFETRIRQDLSDSGSPPLLSSADLDRHVDHAARDLSLVAPLAKVIGVNATPNSRVIDLTSALAALTLVRVLAVEWPTAAFPKSWTQWELFGNQLTLLVPTAPAGADAVNVYARVAMVCTASSATSTIPASYDDLIARRAGAYAAQELAARLMNTINIGGPVVWEHYLTLSQTVLKDSDAALAALGARPLWFGGKLHAPQLPPQGWSQTNLTPSEEIYP